MQNNKRAVEAGPQMTTTTTIGDVGFFTQEIDLGPHDKIEAGEYGYVSEVQDGIPILTLFHPHHTLSPWDNTIALEPPLTNAIEWIIGTECQLALAIFRRVVRPMEG